MPALTIYLSRLLGVVFLIVAVAMLADREMGVAALGQLGVDRTPLLLLGLVRVVFGVVIVLVHNVWRRGVWPLVVTLTGWAILTRGVMVLLIPPDAIAAIMNAAHVIDFYYLYAAIPLVLGGYLALRGFSVSAPPFEVAGLPIASPPPTKPQVPKNRPRRRR